MDLLYPVNAFCVQFMLNASVDHVTGFRTETSLSNDVRPDLNFVRLTDIDAPFYICASFNIYVRQIQGIESYT